MWTIGLSLNEPTLRLTYIIIHVIFWCGVVLAVCGLHVGVVGYGPSVTVAVLSHDGRHECGRLQHLKGAGS